VTKLSLLGGTNSGEERHGARRDQSNPARLDRIERRLQALEDAEAIRNLKPRYAALCDPQYDAEGIASLFTEDAVWESPALGRFEGREAIGDFFKGAPGIFSFAIHYSLNGHIRDRRRYRASPLVPVHAVHAGRRKPGTVARRYRSRDVCPGGRNLKRES